MTRTDVSDPNHNPDIRSRHSVLVGPMRWYALTPRSDAVFSRTSDVGLHTPLTNISSSTPGRLR